MCSILHATTVQYILLERLHVSCERESLFTTLFRSILVICPCTLSTLDLKCMLKMHAMRDIRCESVLVAIMSCLRCSWLSTSFDQSARCVGDVKCLKCSRIDVEHHHGAEADGAEPPPVPKCLVLARRGERVACSTRSSWILQLTRSAATTYSPWVYTLHQLPNGDTLTSEDVPFTTSGTV